MGPILGLPVLTDCHKNKGLGRSCTHRSDVLHGFHLPTLVTMDAKVAFAVIPSADCYLSQAARGDDRGRKSHFTLSLGTLRHGTDAPFDISTLGAWLSGILECLVPPLGWLPKGT